MPISIALLKWSYEKKAYRFFPYHHFEIKTFLSPQEVQRRLSGVIEPRTFRPTNQEHRPFRGEVQEKSFKIARIISYRNSFQPIISGKLETKMGQTVIVVTMAPHIVVVLFMVVWLSFSAGIFFLLLASWVFSFGTFHVTPALGLSLAAGMFILGYSLFTGAFIYETRKSKSALLDVLKDLFFISCHLQWM